MTERRSDADSWSLDRLERACREQTRRHRANLENDPSFCLTIVVRALTLRAPATNDRPAEYADEPARETLVRIYTDFVRANIQRRALGSLSIEDVEQQVWMRFWSAAGTGLKFPTLPAALHYLKLTTMSALMEIKRAEFRQLRDRSLDEDLEKQGTKFADPRADLDASFVRRRFRARCREVLTDPVDARIYWMRYGMGLKPGIIAFELDAQGVRIRGKVPTARLVSDALDRCFAILAADAEIRDLLQAD
jgi:hypothetical protein